MRHERRSINGDYERTAIIKTIMLQYSFKSLPMPLCARERASMTPEKSEQDLSALAISYRI